MLLPLGSILLHSACKLPYRRVVLIDVGYKMYRWCSWSRDDVIDAQHQPNEMKWYASDMVTFASSRW